MPSWHQPVGSSSYGPQKIKGSGHNNWEYYFFNLRMFKSGVTFFFSKDDCIQKVKNACIWTSSTVIFSPLNIDKHAHKDTMFSLSSLLFIFVFFCLSVFLLFSLFLSFLSASFSSFLALIFSQSYIYLSIDIPD